MLVVAAGGVAAAHSAANVADPVVAVGLALSLAGAILALRSPVPGSAGVVLGALLDALRTGSSIAGAALFLAGLAGVVLGSSPGLAARRVARDLALSLLFALYVLLVALGASLHASGPGGILGRGPGLGILILGLSAHQALVLASIIHPGRRTPRLRGALRYPERWIHALTAIPVVLVVVPSILARPEMLFFLLLGSVAYIWARLAGASRMEALLAFTLVYALGLYLFGAAGTVDSILTGPS